MSFFAALYFYAPIITLFYQSRGLNFVEINSLWGIILAAKSVFEVPTGIIADKIGRKYSLIAALFLQLIGEVVYVFANDYWLFAFVAVIAGIGFAFSSGCFEAMLYDTLKTQNKENDMQKVMGTNNAFAQAGFMVSALIGGFIVSDLNIDKFVLLIIMTAVCVGIAFLVSFLLREPKTEYWYGEKSPLELFKASANLLKTNKSLRKIVLLSLFATPFANYLGTFYQPYFVQAHVPGFLFGVALSVAALLGIFASKYAYLMEKILTVRWAVLVSTAIPAALYIFLALVFSPIFSFILFVVASSSMELQKPIFSDYFNRHIDSGNRATALSVIGMISGIYVWLMGLVIGAIADYSLSYAFIFMALVICAGIIFFRVGKSDVELKMAEQNHV